MQIQSKIEMWKIISENAIGSVWWLIIFRLQFGD